MHIDILAPFFYAFRSEDLPLWLSICIFAFTAIILIIYIFNFYIPVHNSLRRALRKLDKISGKEQFFNNFDKIDTIFSSNSLKHTWDEFKESFIFPNKYDEEKIIRNTIRPQSFFNFDTLSQQYNLSLYQSLPNSIVGVGLLLTFCGLVSAIYLTGESISSASTDDVLAHTENLKTALDSLLKIAAFKFLTSIAGLVSSLFLSFAFRFINGIIRNDYHRLTTSLERNLQYESQEHLICAQQSIALRQLEYLRKNNDQLRTFAESYANEMAQKTALAVNSVAKLHLERLAPTMDSAVT
ncbi:MAG: hypothetical protein J5803_02110, partial [Desulfovibrio sp.]|nr:hypothetical protein [Desulfovibrio sp.]